MSKFRKKPVVIEAVRWRGFNSNLGITEEPPGQPLDLTPENMHLVKWGPLPEWLPAVSGVIETIPEGQVPSIPVGTIFRQDDVLWIGTLEGAMRADRGDWIIRGIKGEIYPCKPDIFAATYDQVG